MLILDKRKYERIVSELIDARDIREIVDKYSIDRIYYYHILKDISSGQRSPNFKYLQSIARKRKLNENFIIEQSKTVLSFFIPYYQSYQSDSLDYYKILNVNRNAAEEEIRRSWIELMKSHHPDKAGAEGLDVAKQINEAYEVLSNSAKREAYDNKHLPAMPVIIPEHRIKKYYYAVPAALAIFFVIMYASGSGLIFKSQEEKEKLAKVIEDPSIPNAVYKGDLMKDKPGEEDSSRIKPIEPARDSNGVEARNESKPVEPRPDHVKSADEKPAGEVVAAANDIASNKTEIKSAESQEKESPAVNSENPEGKESWTKEQAAAGDRETVPAAGEAEKKMEITQISPGEAEKAAPGEAVADTNLKQEEKKVAEKPVPEEKPEIAAKEPEHVAKSAVTEKAAESRKDVSKIASAQSSSVEETPDGAKYHTVKRGESLWSIAHKYETTTAELNRINNIGNSKINIGDKLLISGSGVPLHAADSVRVAAVNKVNAPEPIEAAPAKKPEILRTIITKAEPAEKSPAKSSITAGFNSDLAKSAVAIRNTEVRAPQPVPRVRPPDTQSLYSFVNSYVSAYKNKDIDRVKALFAPDAKENGVNITRVISSYISNFSRLEIVRYDVTVSKATFENSSGVVIGDFFITFKDQRTGVLKNSRGNINWKLSWADGGWKIQELTYKIESTNSYGG